MTLIVEDGTGLNNANSYISVADCGLYHDKMGNTLWTGSDSAKEVALRRATQYIDNNYRFIGYIKEETQSLSWPRYGAIDYDGRTFDDIVPQKIKDAVSELALSALSGNLETNLDSSNYIKRQRVGELEIEYKEGSPTYKIYNLAQKIISDLIILKVSGSTRRLERS